MTNNIKARIDKTQKEQMKVMWRQRRNHQSHDKTMHQIGTERVKLDTTGWVK